MMAEPLSNYDIDSIKELIDYYNRTNQESIVKQLQQILDEITNDSQEIITRNNDKIKLCELTRNIQQSHERKRLKILTRNLLIYDNLSNYK